MANGPYSQSGGYRSDRTRDERDFSRDDISGVRHVQNNLRINNNSTDTISGSTTL